MTNPMRDGSEFNAYCDVMCDVMWRVLPDEERRPKAEAEVETATSKEDTAKRDPAMQTVQMLTAVKPVTVTCLITCCECLSSDRTLLHREDISRQGERVEF
ncbi:Hypothetical predicted protein [Xyrichtys novacula]|uniref:Uncharacterized protein n=1 Tax=Xyrichtys novacula TaxID=13765 RepID=A0AAV1FZG3_XYRNO|nr:Hypothetical predicted protein [Xyrichtys novacula]